MKIIINREIYVLVNAIKIIHIKIKLIEPVIFAIILVRHVMALQVLIAYPARMKFIILFIYFSNISYFYFMENA